jgi:hypothetical protein
MTSDGARSAKNPCDGVAEVAGVLSDPVRLLLELKNLRKEARHRASRAFDPWLTDNWEEWPSSSRARLHCDAGD